MVTDDSLSARNVLISFAVSSLRIRPSVSLPLVFSASTLTVQGFLSKLNDNTFKALRRLRVPGQSDGAQQTTLTVGSGAIACLSQ